jgi:uroporphyrin-III C-methyltransferase
LFVAENAADIDSTLVVYMGLSTFPSISLKLIHHGLPSNTPAVAVERGTTLQQRTVSTILHITLSFSSSLAMFIFCQAL